MVHSIDLIGYVGALLTTIAFVPQIILAWRSDDLSSISLTMYIVFVAGVVFSLAFAILADIMPTILANAVTLLLAGSVLYLKVRDLSRRRWSNSGDINSCQGAVEDHPKTNSVA